MSDKKRAVQLPSSERTLQQPSRMTSSMAAGLARCRPVEYPAWTATWDHDSSPVPPPSYSEPPPCPWGETSPNTARHWGPAWSGFQLNTPPPLMCTSPAPPNRADPFPRGPHAFRVLGGPTWMPHSDSHPGRMVLQLSAEEDLAITCLLKLHHQDPKDPQVGWGGFGPTDEGMPEGTAAPPSGAEWTEFRRLDDVEHYEEYLLPIPPPSRHDEHP